MQIKIKKLFSDVKIPAVQTLESVGYDIYAYLNNFQGMYLDLPPMRPILIPCGFCLELPYDVEAQIRLRSSFALKGLIIPNAPTTTDPDYRGEIKVVMMNLMSDPYRINHGDRIAQMVFAHVVRPELVSVDVLGETSRGDGGYGSTGR